MKKQAATDKNLICKRSQENKKPGKFFGIMMRNENGRGTSVTVYNLDTKTVVKTVTPEAAKAIRNFKLTDTTLVVKFINKTLKAKTYSLVETNKECKKCKRVLETQAAGAVIKTRAYGIFPASKK